MHKFLLEPPVECTLGALRAISLVEISSHAESDHIVCIGRKIPVAIFYQSKHKTILLARDQEQIDIDTCRLLIE